MTVVRGLASANVEAMTARRRGRRAVRAAAPARRLACWRCVGARWPAAAPRAAEPRPPLAHEGRWFTDAARPRGDPARRQHGLQGRLLPPRRHRLRPRRRPLPAPPRLQHGPARDHLQGARAEAARRRARRATAAATCAASRAPSSMLARRRGSSPCSTSTRTSTTSASRARAGPTGRRSTTASRPSRRRASPATTSSTPGLQRAFDNFWANTRGRGPRPPGRLRRRPGGGSRRSSAERPYVDRLRPAQRAVAGHRLRPDGCVNTAGCPTFDTTTLAAVPRPRARRDPRRRPRDADLLRAAGHLRLRRRLRSIPTPATPRAGFSLPRLLPARRARRPGLRARRASRSRTWSFANADKQSEETGDVPFLTEFGATDDLETIERIVRLADDHMVSWQYWHYCDCDDPTTSGPGRAVAGDRPVASRRGATTSSARSCALLARPYPRAVAGTPRSFGFDPRRGASTSSTRPGRRTEPELGRRLPRSS